MKKFKIFFYPIYLIVALVVLYYSIDILAHMDAYKEKLDFNLLRKLPGYMLYLLLVVSLLMLTEVILENLQIMDLRSKLRKANEELVRLKAKLYDKAEGTELPEETETDEDEE